jgi:hypothetical protein
MLLAAEHLRIATQALNECVNGFGMELAGKLSFDRENGLQQLDKLGSAYDRHEGVWNSQTQETWVAPALEATFRKLDWDYGIRMGATVEEAQALREEIDAELGAAAPITVSQEGAIKKSDAC